MPEAAFGTFAREARVPGGGGGTPSLPGYLFRFNARGRKAVRILHEAGVAQADQELAAGSKNDLAHSNKGIVTQTRNVIDAFDNYKKLQAADGRGYIEVNVKHPVAYGPDLLHVKLDVVLDAGGGAVTPRMVLWDVADCTLAQAEVLSHPALLAAEALYGAGNVDSIQVWQLRRPRDYVIDPATARARGAQAAALVARVAQ